MNMRLISFVAVLTIWCAGDARAQVPQVVQLPTFSFFSVSTTVVVPDSGRGFLGGVNRARYGSTSRGIPLVSKVPGLGRLARNRGIGSSLSSSGASVTATIIDHAEHDRRILGEAASRRGAPLVLSATDRKAAFLTEHIGRRENDSVLTLAPTERPKSKRDIQERLAEAELRTAAEIESYLTRARKAVDAGRLGAARCCYNVVIRRGNEAQKLEARTQLAAMVARDKGVALATRED